MHRDVRYYVGSNCFAAIKIIMWNSNQMKISSQKTIEISNILCGEAGYIL